MSQNESEIEFIIFDLKNEKYRSDQIEKNIEKWIKKILKNLYDQTVTQSKLVQLLNLILGTI